MKISDYHLGFIGFGHMAQIIFTALDRAKLFPHSNVSFIQRDTHKMRENEKKFGITSTSLKTMVEKSDILILGVRPNQAKIVLEELKKIGVPETKMILTVLAGTKLGYYEKFLKNPVVRVMPNVASEVGMGMSLLSYSQNVGSDFKSLARILFASMGEVMEIREEMMDISCALAGSGPGFVFRLIEAMAKMGEKEGLAFSDALKMAAQTFMGAAKLVLKKGDIESLIVSIATPNGVTEAGLRKMSELNLYEHFQSVIAASEKRSKELSEE